MVEMTDGSTEEVAEEPGWTFIALIGLIRLTQHCGLVILCATHPTMFPTLFVATSEGLSNLFARIAVTMAPLLAEVDFPLPLLILSGFTGIAFIANFFIKPVNE